MPVMAVRFSLPASIYGFRVAARRLAIPSRRKLARIVERTKYASDEVIRAR